MAEMITSRRNENIVHLRKLAADKGYRRHHGQFVCEGIKLFREAVMWNADIHSVFVCGGFDGEIPGSVKRFDVSRDILEYASSQKTPQDIIFTCAIKDGRASLDVTAGNILLENIQDPGNLGTILRSADAFGIKSVILLGACADPYNPKSVRASMGAVFRCNVIEIGYDELEKLQNSGMKLYGASLGEASRAITDVDLRGVTVAIGNEGSGLSGKILDMCNKRVIIPIAPDCESLNAGVAAAVIMWEMSKVNNK